MEDKKQSVFFVLQNYYEPVPGLEQAQPVTESIFSKAYFSSGGDDKRMNDKMEIQRENRQD